MCVFDTNQLIQNSKCCSACLCSAGYLNISKTKSNRLSGNIEDINVPDENPPLSKRLDMNLGEKYIKPKQN